jgi:intraflagellar transport protein 80
VSYFSLSIQRISLFYLTGAGGNGSVIFAQVVDRHFEWKNCQVTLLEPRKIRVQDVASETLQDLAFARDRVVEVGLGKILFLLFLIVLFCFIFFFAFL